jgi:hypothetical protein
MKFSAPGLAGAVATLNYFLIPKGRLQQTGGDSLRYRYECRLAGEESREFFAINHLLILTFDMRL